MSRIAVRPVTGRQVAASVGGVVGFLALAGCGSALSVFGGSSSEAVLTVTPGTQGDQAAANAPVSVAVDDGQLVAVTVSGPKGPVAGRMNLERTQWTSNQSSLSYGSDYEVKAQAVDSDGKAAEIERSFTTIDPGKTVEAEFAYFETGDTVGVGMPLRLEFSQPIKNQAQVERRLRVVTSKPVVGAWSWERDRRTVTFRPQSYWPAGARVSVDVALRGIETSKGVYGERDFRTRFKIGPSMISTVDASAHQMTVVRNGKVVQRIPVTSGKYGFETRSGIKPIMAKEGTVIMDAASGGTPRNSSEYYRLTVNYSMRMTPSGEFVHAAPWSGGSQGYSNVSHGCVGMSTGYASWLYENTNVGDVVVVKNSGREQDLGNGITDWNVPWSRWLAKSKTGAYTVGPHGMKRADGSELLRALPVTPPKSTKPSSSASPKSSAYPQDSTPQKSSATPTASSIANHQAY